MGLSELESNDMVLNDTVLNDVEREELLGAYALDALDPEEAAAVEDLLARRPDLAREADRLAGAAAHIGADASSEVPASLRGSVLARVQERRIDLDDDPAAGAYAASASRLRDAMEDLDPSEFAEPTPNGLNARDLIVHLAAQDSLVAQVVDRTVVSEITEADVDLRTDAFVERFRDHELHDVIDVWSSSARAVEAWAREDTSAPTISWLGLDLPRDNVLTARAFENWIHCDDLRRVEGREPEAPPSAELHLMTNLAVGTLPFGLVMTGNARPGKVARFVLTGPGGGEWTIGMGGERVTAGAVPDVTVSATALDWCLVAGQRLEPTQFLEAIAADVVGDSSLVEPLVAAAPAFATL
jgi:uncharacterized protein (TIGR03083 family)